MRALANLPNIDPVQEEADKSKIALLKGTAIQSWSRFVRQAAKVDSPTRRTIHHEDAQTVHS